LGFLRNNISNLLHRNGIADKTLLELLKRFFPKPCRLLEAGSNTGHLSLALAKYGYSITLLDCLEEPINAARRIFAGRGHEAEFIVDNILNVEGAWDGVWNTGVLQCYRGCDRQTLVEKLCSLAPACLFVYPDVSHPSFQHTGSCNVTPGLAGCREYFTDDIPDLVANYCQEIRNGQLDARLTGVGFPFEYTYGSRR